MNTTTAQYKINVVTSEGTESFIRTMPTRPTSKEGVAAQCNRLSVWIEKEYPNYTDFDITPI